MSCRCKKGFLKDKRGQFTIFVIVGLVVFFVFAFAVYSRIKIVNAQLAIQADNQLEEYINKNFINQYVTGCLDVIADDAMIQGLMQGGTFNFTDKTEYRDYIEYNDSAYGRLFNVSIAVYENSQCPDPAITNFIVTQEPGPYPLKCRNEYVNSLPAAYNMLKDPCANRCSYKSYRAYSGFFGVNNLSMLCNPLGGNRHGNIYGVATCEYYDNYRKSMQRQLEEQIEHEIGKCVNFTQVLSTTSSNITQNGAPNVTVIFRREGTIVKLSYPFTITLRGRQPVTRFAEFSVDKDIPFKELYEFSYELANNDVKDAQFNIFFDKEKTKGGIFNILRAQKNVYSDNYDVNIIYGNNTNGYTNIVQVIDRSHRIRGLPLTMNFAVKNRRPVLDYMHTGKSTETSFDIAVVENQIVRLVPMGYDPDDENGLKYFYSDWLETYNDYYNWSDARCDQPESLGYILANCTKKDTSAPGHNWTLSYDYMQTQKNASSNVSHEDIGLHVVRINVVDRAGLYDYQDVRILVFDLPQARINASNYYDDVEENRASFEDLYMLNGSQSTVGAIASTIPGVSLKFFVWNDSVEPFKVNKTILAEENKILRIPYDVLRPDELAETLDIISIKNYIFDPDVGPKEHNITLSITNSLELVGDNKYVVNVTKCLNHSSGTPSYPFDVLYGVDPNNLSGHLQANHTCCTDGYDYAPQNTLCYGEDNYGAYNSFKDYRSLPHITQYEIQYMTDHGPIGYDALAPYRYDNDIFLQRFGAYCSNDRGNICSGDVNDIREVIVSCSDDNDVADRNLAEAFSKERCQGPLPDYRGINSSQPMSTQEDKYKKCQNYESGQSFEKLWYGGTYDGICTQGPQCSNGQAFKAYSLTIEAKYSCEGQCGDGKCNVPILSTCSCEKACDNDVARQCDGVPYGSADNPGYKELRTCSDFGKNYFEDICSDCGIKDEGRTCRSSSVDRSYNNCYADPSCNGVEAGEHPSETICTGYTRNERTRRAVCSDGCTLEPDMNDDICRANSDDNGCIADPICDGTKRNSKVLDTALNPNQNIYCDNDCNHQICEDGFRAQSNGQCVQSCTQDSQCTPGYVCCLGTNCPIGLTTGKCYEKCEHDWDCNGNKCCKEEDDNCPSGVTIGKCYRWHSTPFLLPS